MMGQPPWVWHDFKIRWNLVDVAEPSAIAGGRVPTTRGLVSKDDDNQQPAAKLVSYKQTKTGNQRGQAWCEPQGVGATINNRIRVSEYS